MNHSPSMNPTGCELEIPGARDTEPSASAAWMTAFLALGVVLRLARFVLTHPLWRDEAYLAVNLLDRDFAGLSRPLDYQQVCPWLFLGVEKVAIETLGFGEWSLRLAPTIASILSLFLMRDAATRLLRGAAPVLAVAILAIGYTPIRHGGEAKPYATDFLAALGLIALAARWLESQRDVGPIWGLAILGPVAVAISNPAIFVAAGVGLVLAVPALRTRSLRVVVPMALFGAGTAGTFLALLRWVNAGQGDRVMAWMRIYWAGSFPPRSPLPLLAWLAKVHTSYAFAYPAGGDHGASMLTTVLVVIGIIAMYRRGSRAVLALLLAPFPLGLAAASLGRYPYGGSARTMQYVAPSIILLMSLGIEAALARLPHPNARRIQTRGLFPGLAIIGLGMLAWDVTHPFKEPLDQASRDFARRFWADQAVGAEVVCARSDLHLPLNPLTWQNDRAAVYICHRAIALSRHEVDTPRLDRVAAAHPLRVVVFNEDPGDAAAVARWIAAQGDQLRLRSRSEQTLHKGWHRGKASLEERYVVYELIPRADR